MLARSRFPVVEVLLAGVLSSCQPATDVDEAEPGAAQPALIGGEEDKHDPSVVQVVWTYPPSTLVNFACTGTVVSPHVVLTAAHCLDLDTIGMEVGFQIFIGNDVHDPAQQKLSNLVDVTEAHFHEGWSTSKLGVHDIGVLITKDPLPGPPQPMSRRALSADDIGLAVRVVGNGITVDSDAAKTGKTHEYQTKILGVMDLSITYDEPTRATCFGDSGGPSFATWDGVEQIIGVHSGSLSPDGTCLGGVDYDSRIDVDAASFVDPFISLADPGFVPPGQGGGAGGTGGTAGAGGTGGMGGGGAPSESSAAGGDTDTAEGGCAYAGAGAGSNTSAPLWWLILSAMLVAASRRSRSALPGA